jgi:predicted TPR repeat methyltransferase
MKNRLGAITRTKTPGYWDVDPLQPTAIADESPEALFRRASALHKSGLLDVAEPLYRELLALQPENGDALHLLGVLHYQRREPAAAAPLIESALKYIPDNIHAWAGLGLALLRLDRHTDALDAFDKALAIKPDYAEAFARRGEALQGLGRQADALTSYGRSLQLRPNHLETLNSRGTALLDLGRLGEALNDFDQALKLNPDYIEALNNRASALNRLKHFAEALSTCERALLIRPDVPDLLNNRGVALHALGRREEAVAAFMSALEMQPHSPDFHANLGVTLQELGRFEAAELQLGQALAIKPAARTFQSLAETLYHSEKFEAAKQVYQQWLDFEPDNPIPQHMVAVGSGAAPARASDAYVAELFDKFAESFDSTLLGLGYRTPELLAAQLRTVLGNDPRPLRILDAGCGTGLAAPLLKPLASQLVGVDLSSGMLDKARERHLYDELVVGELCAFMASRPAAFDLIIIADTLVYFGELREAFATACRALAPDGILAFTVESRPTEDNSPGYKLEPHGRYSHRPDYVTQLLIASGYTICTTEAVTLRRELKADVAGMAVVARRKPA